MYLWESKTAPTERAAADLGAAWGLLAMRNYLFLPSVQPMKEIQEEAFFPTL